MAYRYMMRRGKDFDSILKKNEMIKWTFDGA
jgi:hypothetical protein